MYKIEIKNASVRDMGLGLQVNDKYLNEIISTLLRTRAGEKTAFTSNKLERFYHNSCDVTVIIEPHPTQEYLEDDLFEYSSVKDLEDDRCEQFNEKSKTTDAEE